MVRGKTLGGSSALNIMLYNRATIGTMSKWAQDIGDDSYQWDDIFPYYQKSVNYTPPNVDLQPSGTTVPIVQPSGTPVPIDGNAFVPGNGPLHVSYPNWGDSSAPYFVSGYEELGIEQLPDNINNGALIGHGVLPLTIDPEYETRSSSQTSFLDLALKTTPLTVYTRTMVEKILFDSNKTATGVQVKTGGMPYQITAKEVILSAGALQSPRLLMVSGIGPAQELEKHNISVLVDSPGVGQNIQDNPLICKSHPAFLQPRL